MIINRYTGLKNKHSKEFSELPLFFAFNNMQLEEGMKKLELNKDDKKELVSIGHGAYMKKVDIQKYEELTERHDVEFKNCLDDEVFIYQMFKYELANHEYNYTLDLTDTLEALGLTSDQVSKNIKLKNGLKKAIKDIIAA